LLSKNTYDEVINMNGGINNKELLLTLSCVKKYITGTEKYID